MKKNTYLLLLTTLLASCTIKPFYITSENESESIKESESLSESESISEQSSISESESTKQDLVHTYMQDYLGSDNDVYRINITSNSIPTDKENYVSGSLNITEQDTSIVNFNSQKMKFKLRGNSTLAADKKAYKIKFDSKQSLFGLTKNKSYVLLANYYDRSNIRNYLAYTLANKLDNLKYQPSSIFVDLYINNSYEGLYLLCEQMEANPGRVDIKDNISEDGIDSFMIEADVRAKDEYCNYSNVYVEEQNYVFIPKYPDPDDYVEAKQNVENGNYTKDDTNFINQYEKDIEWLKSYMSNITKSIKDMTFEKTIDVDSFVDYYLVEEFFKNVDVGSTSQYYYIDQKEENPKLHAGPVWDFDIACGVIDSGTSSIYNGYKATKLYVRNTDYYTKELFKSPIFSSKVCDRFKEIKPLLQETIDEIATLQVILDKAFQRNLNRWPYKHTRDTWIEIYCMGKTVYSYYSYTKQIELVRNTLTKQLKILNDNYYYEEQE